MKEKQIGKDVQRKAKETTAREGMHGGGGMSAKGKIDRREGMKG